MASKLLTLQADSSFTLESFAQRVKESNTQKGYNVAIVPLTEDSVQLIIEKDTDGIKNLLGLSTKEKVNMTVYRTESSCQLTCNFSDEAQTGRIIDIAVGWFVCFVPFITGIVGFVNNNKYVEGLQQELTAYSHSATN